MSSSVEQIKDRLSIVDVISSYLKLEKAGLNLKAKCPFHNEKTPSFFVSPNRNTYHCFGCNRGGDIFSFVQEIEGLTFPEALLLLGQKAGVKLETFNGGDSSKSSYDLFYKILESATKFFESNLEKNNKVLDYLKKRGLKVSTIKSFRLGFAPDGWRNLLAHLKSEGFKEEAMLQVGLIAAGSKNNKITYYDRFRNRIIFPIADREGRILGFSGRILDEVSGPDLSQKAKYINSPETVLYHKSKILYGFDKAKRSILQNNFTILVEGQMDLILAHQAGNENTVALSGTALSEDHLKLLKRLSETLILAFDSDEAGFLASLRSFKIALSMGLEVKVLALPPGLDPALFILKNPIGWQTALKAAKHIVLFYLDCLLEKNLSERDFQREISKKVLPLVAIISNKMDQSFFVKKIAEVTFLDSDSIRQELVRVQNKILAEEPVYPIRSEALDTVKSGGELNFDKVLGFFIWQRERSTSDLDLTAFEKRFEAISGQKIDDLILKMDLSRRQDLSFQSEFYWKKSPDLEKNLDQAQDYLASLKLVLEELLDSFELEFLEDKLKKVLTLLKQHERAPGKSLGTEGASDSLNVLSDQNQTILLKECQIITSAISQIKNKRFNLYEKENKKNKNR